jgi:hypothetical protein
MDNKIVFDIFKNVIIEQNKLLLKEISEKFDLDYEYLIDKYIKPSYYLPVVIKTTDNNTNDKVKN